MRGLQYDTNKFAASRWIAEKTSEFVVQVYGVGEKMVEISRCGRMGAWNATDPVTSALFQTWDLLVSLGTLDYYFRKRFSFESCVLL